MQMMMRRTILGLRGEGQIENSDEPQLAQSQEPTLMKVLPAWI